MTQSEVKGHTHTHGQGAWEEEITKMNSISVATHIIMFTSMIRVRVMKIQVYTRLMYQHMYG